MKIYSSLLPLAVLISGCCSDSRLSKSRSVTPLYSSTGTQAPRQQAQAQVLPAPPVSRNVEIPPTPEPPLAAPVRAQPVQSRAAVIDDGQGTKIFELKREKFDVVRGDTSNGKAVITTTVVSEPFTVPITLERQEIVIERQPASGPTTAPFGEARAVIEIPLSRQTAKVVITPEIYEIVKVSTTTESDSSELTGAIRTEKVDVVPVK